MSSKIGSAPMSVLTPIHVPCSFVLCNTKTLDHGSLIPQLAQSGGFWLGLNQCSALDGGEKRERKQALLTTTWPWLYPLKSSNVFKAHLLWFQVLPGSLAFEPLVAFHVDSLCSIDHISSSIMNVATLLYYISLHS